MLTCHPNICISPEGSWLIKLYPRYYGVVLTDECLETFADDLLATPKIEGWTLDRSGLWEYLKRMRPQDYASLTACVYQYYTDRHQPGKQRWGDKNNYYLDYIQLIATLFPNALFLHIVRDGRDVACSYRDLSETKAEYAPNLPASVCGATLDWVGNENTIQKSFNAIDTARTCTVRYEDLTQHPQETLRAVCTFINEPYDENMLAFAEVNRKMSLEPEMFMVWKDRTKEPVTAKRVGRWRREMFQEDQFLFQLIAKKQLAGYGYDVASPRIRLLPATILWAYAMTTVSYSRVSSLALRLQRVIHLLFKKRNQ